MKFKDLKEYRTNILSSSSFTQFAITRSLKRLKYIKHFNLEN